MGTCGCGACSLASTQRARARRVHAGKNSRDNARAWAKLVTFMGPFSECEVIRCLPVETSLPRGGYESVAVALNHVSDLSCTQECDAGHSRGSAPGRGWPQRLSLIHISEPTRQAEISYAVFC